MTRIPRLSAVLSAGVFAIGLSSPVFGQADNSNSLTAPAWTPNDTRDYPYDTSRQIYRKEASRNRDEIARNRALAPYEAERRYGTPYATDSREAWIDPHDRQRLYFGGPGLAVGRDTNPDDYATGIYNPKQ